MTKTINFATFMPAFKQKGNGKVFMKSLLVLILVSMFYTPAHASRTIVIKVPDNKFDACRSIVKENPKALCHGGGGCTSVWIGGTDQYGEQVVWSSYSNYVVSAHDVRQDAAAIKGKLLKTGVCPSIDETVSY